MKTILLLSMFTLLTPLLSGCSKGPDGNHITKHLQAQINHSLGKGILTIVKLERRGGQSYISADKRSGYLVYFTVTLKFTDNYDTQSWTAQNASTLRSILSTTSTGITGFDAHGQVPGEILTANGLTAFIEESNQWTPSPLWTQPDTTSSVSIDAPHKTDDCGPEKT